MSKKLKMLLRPLSSQTSLLSKQLEDEEIISLEQALCYGLACNQPGGVCSTCYLAIENRFVGLDYIVKKGYVTKEEALEYMFKVSK